ncbi:Multidrug resistance transporter, Bcr/CflA family [Moritella sp. JT01]|uniref:MFS transporter n=1 Tax=Moritella sp. JT01 TaxID=756698 RepID=UPI0007960618|nr:MFS transporter [Moritella sp. JT01]KXO08380.1 Multidrug resistance transporter, Bcr/CflA family [Moritella sp. JT01]
MSITNKTVSKRDNSHVDLRDTKLIYRLVLISLLMACSYFFAADMFAPSLPFIVDAFSSTASTVQQTISVFFVSVACSQLVVGVASERFGRRPLVLIGAVVFVVGTLVCLFSTNITMLIIGRCIQGIGVSALYLLCFTILQDSLSKEELIGILAWFSILFMSIPALAPAIGGLLQSYLGWRSNFKFMLVLSLLILLFTFLFLTETHTQKNPDALVMKTLVADYWMIIKNPIFWIYLLMMVAASGGIMIFYIIGSFVSFHDYGLEPKSFGLTSILIVSCTIASRLFFSYYLKTHVTKRRMLLTGGAMMLVASGLLVLNIELHLFTLMLIAICLYAFSSGLLTATAAVSALYLFPNHKGQVGATFGALQMLGLFSLTQLSAHLPDTELVLASMFIALSVLTLLSQCYPGFVKHVKAESLYK